MSRSTNLRLVTIDGDLVAPAEAPAIDPVERAAANDPTPSAPGWAPEAVEDAPAAPPAPAGRAARRWLPSLALSLAAHTVLVALVATALTRAGGEAETDSVAVEIVFEAPPAVPAEPAPAEAAETVATEESPIMEETPVETAGNVPPTDAATEALLAEPPLVEILETIETAEPEVADAVEAAEPEAANVVEAAAVPAEAPAETPPPVETAAIVPPDAATEALLAEPPVVEPEAPEAVEPVEAPASFERAAAEPGEPAEDPAPTLAPVVAAEEETFTVPAPDPALAVLSVPPAFADAPAVTRESVAPPIETADTTLLPDTVTVAPEPRPQAKPLVSKDQAAPPAPAKKPTLAKTAEAKATEIRTAEAPKKRERAADAKPAPAAKQPSAHPAAKKPEKSEAGAGAAASAGASAGEEAAYGRKLLAHVERHKRYPAAARAANLTGAVRLSVTIERGGQLRSARVTGGSGHAMLDEEALATARRAAPYPAPPDGVGGKTYAFSVTLRFSR